jgi:hypothetical protein
VLSAPPLLKSLLSTLLLLLLLAMILTTMEVYRGMATTPTAVAKTETAAGVHRRRSCSQYRWAVTRRRGRVRPLSTATTSTKRSPLYRDHFSKPASYRPDSSRCCCCCACPRRYRRRRNRRRRGWCPRPRDAASSSLSSPPPSARKTYNNDEERKPFVVLWVFLNLKLPA